MHSGVHCTMLLYKTIKVEELKKGKKFTVVRMEIFPSFDKVNHRLWNLTRKSH